MRSGAQSMSVCVCVCVYVCAANGWKGRTPRGEASSASRQWSVRRRVRRTDGRMKSSSGHKRAHDNCPRADARRPAASTEGSARAEQSARAGAATEGAECVPHRGHVLQPHTVPAAPWQEVPFQSCPFQSKQPETTTARLIRQRPTALCRVLALHIVSTRVLCRLWSRTQLTAAVHAVLWVLTRGEVAAH